MSLQETQPDKTIILPWKRAEGEECDRLHAYFAASNTRDGFLSRYESCFRKRADRVCLLLGGPGTGKSTFLRQIARGAVARGMETEIYYCSSDPDSLDGVLVSGERESFAVVDATAPHSLVPQSPGIRDEIINLGDFWNRGALLEKREEIGRLNEEKSIAYRRAYRYLGTVGAISDEIRDLTLSALNEVKLRRLGDRLLRDIPLGGQGRVILGLDTAFGMRGRERLDTYLRLGKRVCVLQNKAETGYLLMEYIVSRAKAAGWDYRISYDPILPDRVNALCLRNGEAAFLVCEQNEVQAPFLASSVGRIINCGTLLDGTGAAKASETLRRCLRLRTELTECAADCMRNVEKAHFALEKCYRSAMDFQAKEAYTHALIPTLFSI